MTGISDLAGKASEITGDLTGKAQDYMNSDSFKKILPYLISGGTGAVVGGALSGRRRKNSGEGRLRYLARILGNATMAGGLAAGGHYLLGKGIEKTKGSVDSDSPITGAEQDTGPLASTTKNILFSPATAAGAGALGLGLTDKLPGIGAGRKGQADALDALIKRMPNSQDASVLRTMKSPEISNLKVPGNLQHLRQRAGLPSGNGIKGLMSTLGRKGLLSTLGQTYPQRAGRGALGLAAAGIPALLGAYLTD